MRRMKKKGVNRGKEKRRKKRTKRRRSKEDVMVFSSVVAFGIFSQGRDLESCGGLSWEDLLEKHEDLSVCEPDSCAHVRVVLDVTDVCVFLSSVVASSCCGDWEDVVPQSFSLQKASTLLYNYAGGNEV